MPYVDIRSTDDYAALWYTTNTPFRNVGGFDPNKPTVMILHPSFLCSRWLDNQFGDLRLDSGYNIIAFDMRVAGKSVSRPTALHDSWVDAADLAFAASALRLPPVHILALEGAPSLCALRFALLFPEKCLSITLSNMPMTDRERWARTAFDELLQSWCTAADLESFEYAAAEAVRFVVGPSCEPGLQDELISYWETELPPSRSQKIVQMMNVLVNRTPLPSKVLSRITQPVLILHAERSETCPPKYANRLAEQLVNSQGGAIVYTVRGASGCLSIVPGHASIANQVFGKFLARLPRVRSDLKPPEMPLRERMHNALESLAEIMDDESIAKRDPLSPLSFSCLPPDVVSSQSEALRHYGEIQKTAFVPLGTDGRPARKFSERKLGHWFHSERNGLSTAGVSVPISDRQKKELEPEVHEVGMPLSPPEPTSPPPYQTATQVTVSKANNQPPSKSLEMRVRRTTVTTSTPGALDKLANIRGPMARVVASPPIMLQKYL